MKVKAKIKTLEELLLTEGVTYEFGAFTCRGERNCLPSSMFKDCGKEVVGDLTTHGNVKIGLGGYIEPWMCSSWIQESKQDRLDNFKAEKIELESGRWIKVDINHSNVDDFIKRRPNIFISTNSHYLGINFDEWLAISKKVNEIIELKAELMEG